MNNLSTQYQGISNSNNLFYDTIFNNWSNNLDNRLIEDEKESSYKYSTIYDETDIISFE